MGKYAKYQHGRTLKPERPHPVWRGIGCLLMIIVPAMAYALASILVPIIKATGKLPAEIFRPVRFPDWVLRTRVLGDVAHWLTTIDNLWALAIFFFIALVVLAGLFSFLYASVYQVVGPPRYTVLDAPPTSHKAGKHSR
jgi:hypothetical protein